MADDYALALQKALVATLKSNAALSALVGSRVYDEPPQKVTRPYVRIGGITVRPLRSDCGQAATLTYGVEVHSRPLTSGRVEATRCAGAVVAALDNTDLTISGFTLVQNHYLTQDVTPDTGLKSYTAVVAFQAILDG